jgi:hypothetical protein
MAMRKATGSMAAPEWARRIWVLRKELDHLVVASDRADPVEETVLSLYESTVHAATAAGLLREDLDAPAAAEAMRDMLAAARAAVVAASFALAQDTAPPGEATS